MPEIQGDRSTTGHLVDEPGGHIGEADRAPEAHGGIIAAARDDATPQHVGQEGGIPLDPREGLRDRLLCGEAGDQALRYALEHIDFGTGDDEGRVVSIPDVIACGRGDAVPLPELQHSGTETYAPGISRRRQIVWRIAILLPSFLA